MKNVLFINGHLNAGGCERSLVDVLKHFDYQKYNVDLLLLEGTGDYLDEIPDEVTVLSYPLGNAFGPFGECVKRALQRHDGFSLRFRLVYMLSRKAGAKYLKHVRSLFPNLKNSYDTVIAYRPGICTEFAAYVIPAGRKISWWHHGSFDYSESQADQLNLVYAEMDAVAAVSESCAEIVRNHFSNAEGKVTVIPNMVCAEELRDKSILESPLPDLNENAVKLVSVGRMAPEKNMRICSETGKLLAGLGIAFSWVLIGDGPEEQIIRESIKENGLESYFQLPGRMVNPYPQMAKADILIHPSTVESQGLTVLEAMALHKPVVAVKSRGTQEYMVNGVNGFLTDSNPEEIARAVCTLLDDPQLAADFVDKESEVIELFTPERVMAQIESII